MVVSIPGGAEAASRTFNPRLGIEGGLSILGTSGIVEPMSERALVDSIRLELSRIIADGGRAAVLTPGNYGEAYLKEEFSALAPITVNARIFLAKRWITPFARVWRILLVGHAGKLIKLAGGIMNTHSSLPTRGWSLLPYTPRSAERIRIRYACW